MSKESKSADITDVPEISSAPVYDNCYCWLFMKGDSYLPGIFTSVYSVWRTDPEADLVVMVTDDISEEAKTTLMKVATHLFYIPYLTFESKPLKTQRQRDIYKNWMSSSYTKWNALALPYKKAILIDGDTIHTDNTDSLFKLPTPAAPFSNPFAKPLGTISTRWKGPKGPDKYLTHGAKVTADEIKDTLYNGNVLITATAIVLSPSFDDYFEYIKTVKSMQPFGFEKCNNVQDEQSICYYYAVVKKQDWYNVHHRYNYIAWKDGFLNKGDVPYIIHYFSDMKPWMQKYNTYEDVITWYKMAGEAIKKTKIKPADIKLTVEDVNSANAATDTFIKKHMRVNSVLDILGKLNQ
jgi:lipopolysaccharide biosynthesis glycosyltransferase